ncbi:tRNA lysidine(34) synthetase TilS [Anaerobacillus sp. MEB173]|uniref:tRNA lysidine(34) synthetase TilS n=1 Tax=Anaerobacillus sp. MEB173 TaxID=3383345 RepID=UPI003F901BFC
MNQTVNRFIERHNLLRKGATIVIGVSGGPDSMALLHYLWTLQANWNLTIIAAHVDHMFRGEESFEDLKYVQQFCHEKEIFFEAEQIDVNAYKREHHLSSQVAARLCRYRFFAQVMEKHAADLLALAHHGDDQIETMLMRQVRGSLTSGLAGIPVKRPFHNGYIIRPFLGISKDQIAQYCKESKIEPRIDESNERDDYTRNRFRHHVLPFLKAENPNVHVRFQQQSEMLRNDQLLLEQLATERLDKVTLKVSQNSYVVCVKAFNRSPISLQRRMIQLILNYLYDQVPPSLSSIHIEGFISLLNDTYPSGRLDFPLGLKVIKSYDHCSLSFQSEVMKEDSSYHHRIHIPGIVILQKGKIISEVIHHYPEKMDGNNIFVCDMNTVRLPLLVRTRKAGDRISPFGMKGTKKVKSLFIEEKVNLNERDSWPIVVDGNEQIIWIPGLKRSSLAVVSQNTTEFLTLTYQPFKEQF